ncbi:MAG: 7-cyano-7-deazaguanine synthase QueC [Planctomycetes bacterium]|nr:7-cyano-7-deazaguanine synthase QueC [Planctomycetota bacterium]
MTKRAVVLLSGGLDSATAFAIAKSEGYEVVALSFRYGQRHAVELTAAAKVAEALGAEDHRVVDIDLRAFGGSALTADIAVPKDRDESQMSSDIPVTYVPARNTIFLSFALALAEVTDSRGIFIGVNALDYSGYPDCRPEYVAAFRAVARLATKAGVEGRGAMIVAPLIDKTKAEIIELGARLGVPYELTVSCYDPSDDGAACGRCDSCTLRRKGFEAAGIEDPTRYTD